VGGTPNKFYEMIESDDIAEGDQIIVVNVTSTQTGSGSSNTNSKKGMNTGDFNFQNFDPTTMPQGGGGFAGRNS
jgi:hypothetical protein